MRNLIGVALVLLLDSISTTYHAAQQQQQLEGNWTGGFWLDGNWVAVNVRFNRQNENPGGTADIFFPFYRGRENVINVALDSVKQTADGLYFEIPVGAQKVVFDGRQDDGTISGSYVYDESKGTFGLTHWANVTTDTLEKYYGTYRVSPDRAISISEGWSDPQTLIYVDYKTGQIGTLWAASENEFFSGAGRGVSFPVVLRVSFDKVANGKVK